MKEAHGKVPRESLGRVERHAQEHVHGLARDSDGPRNDHGPVGPILGRVFGFAAASSAQCGRPSEPSYLVAFRSSPRFISQQIKDMDPARWRRWESSLAAQAARRRNGSRLP